MKYEAQSLIFGRKPRQEGQEFKTAFFNIYDVADPFSGTFPIKELDFPNVEKVVLQNESLSYYLEGNDLVITDISSVEIAEEGTTLIVKTTA
ncbi:MAG: hypothetical protein ACMXYK_04575 [Candidatus Woesearchaeota archaeon]